MAPADNLHVWRLADGVQVASFYQRSQTNWAPQWTDDEARMARQVTNEVQVYDGHDPSTGIVQRVRLEGVTMLWTAPGPAPHKFAAFTPEKKVRGAPGSLCVRPHKFLTSSRPLWGGGGRRRRRPTCASTTTTRRRRPSHKRRSSRLRRCPSTGTSPVRALPPPVSQPRLAGPGLSVGAGAGRCTGTRALVLTQTEVDTTGKSYFGETNLYFLDAQGKHDCRVMLGPWGVSLACVSPARAQPAARRGISQTRRGPSTTWHGARTAANSSSSTDVRPKDTAGVKRRDETESQDRALTG